MGLCKSNWTLGACAAAACVAGQDADAAMIVSGAAPVNNTDGLSDYDINGDGTNEFSVDNDKTAGAERYYLKNPNGDNGFMYGVENLETPFQSTSFQVRPYAMGEVIGPGSMFSNDNGDSNAGNYRNNFAGTLGGGGGLFADDGSTQYMGFSWDENGDGTTEYGWVALNFSDLSAGPGSFNILASAWDDSGASVQAGVVPEPAGLALLAMGVGALGIRKRKPA